MTNEEKAVVMGLHVRDLCISKGVTRDNAETASLLVQQSAMEMAEWKDQQFKEYLVNKLKKNFQDFNLNYYSRYRQPYELFQHRNDMIEEIINELFGEIICTHSNLHLSK